MTPSTREKTMHTATAIKKKLKKEKTIRGLSYKDVQIIFLSDGLERIEALMNAGAISKNTLRRAAVEFGNAKVAQAFNDFVKARMVGSGHRGRRPPHAGDNRKYRAQQIGDGGLFIRLPVSGLAKSKGSAVTVQFLSDTIKVKAAE